MTRDRRRAERYPSRLFIELQFPETYEDVVGRGVVVDVSRLGLAVETEADLDIDTTYDCHVEVPFVLKARVVRRYTSGQIKRYGLEIVNQGFMDKMIFKKILKGKKFTRKIKP
jgi:hypothetical protein